MGFILPFLSENAFCFDDADLLEVLNRTALSILSCFLSTLLERATGVNGIAAEG